MTVYVDPLMQHPKSKAWRFGAACHLTADSADELHAFAVRLGLKREWFQERSLMPHYDLTEFKRKAAVARGAVEITHEQSYQRIKAHRTAGVG